MQRGIVLATALLLGLAGGLPASSARRASEQTTQAAQVSISLRGVHTFRLSRGTTQIAFHWAGAPGVRLTYALSRDGRRFAAARPVLRDETGEGRRGGETYGAIIASRGASAVRVHSARPLPRLTLLELADRGPRLTFARLREVAATYPQPSVIPRAGWGADESLRFDASGKEIWPAAFYPVQKVIVHHTATQNADPDPAATIRSIYYYHAITQAWGDIGYNFLIDESGRIYEGRYSRPYAPGESPTGEDGGGNGVTAAHAQGYNSGTVGIALLGTLTSRDATPAARAALEQLIAWIESTHGIDPQGSSLYTNPVSGLQATFRNIAGHRDVGATECPGGSFYATLPTVRSDVASLIASTSPDFSLAASPSSTATIPGGSVSYSVAVGVTNGFTGTVSLAVTGLPGGASASFAPSTVSAPGSAQLTVQTAAAATPGSYPLTISGTGGSLTRTASATLVVQAAPTPDFTLALSPSSRTVVPGQSTTYTVNITPTGGFSGAVTLSAGGLPAGATASFNPNPASGASSTLTVTTSATTPTGSYPLTISGASGSLTHTTAVTLVVNPPPDFSLSLNPTSRSIKRGASTTYTVSVAAQGGFSGSIALAVSGLPSGTSASLSPATVVAPGSSTLRITTTSGAPRGTFNFTVSGSGATGVHAVSGALTLR